MKPTTQTPPSKAELLLKRSLEWIRTHQEQFWTILGTTVAALLLIAFMIQRRNSEADQAWTQLGVTQAYLLQGQTQQAAQALDQWETRFKGTSATAYSQFLRADLLYRTTDYVRAAEIYSQLAQNGEPAPLRPLALSAQAAAEEMAGRLPQAQAAVQQFLDRYPDHFLAASMYMSQARLAEMSNNPAAAAAIYDRYVNLYPQSPWTEFAKGRLQKLSPTALSPAPSPVKK